jgi:phosphatidylglycerol:prolipoprotein diacylglycerol transferase
MSGLPILALLGFGRPHLPVYGLLAVAGLFGALWLSQRTAMQTGLGPEELWDAGIFAVLAAFFASRLLLVAESPRAFVSYPLLVLRLPSFTYAGMLLTALLTVLYLRRKRLPVQSVLDAWAPCAALLACGLQLGDFLARTDAGLPTASGRTFPVGALGAVLAAMLCAGLLWRLRKQPRAGEVAALAMMVGGFLSFLLDTLRQPAPGTAADAWLEPSQWIALGAMLAGAGLWTARSRPAAGAEAGRGRARTPEVMNAPVTAGTLAHRATEIR